MEETQSTAATPIGMSPNRSSLCWNRSWQAQLKLPDGAQPPLNRPPPLEAPPSFRPAGLPIALRLRMIGDVVDVRIAAPPQT